MGVIVAPLMTAFTGLCSSWSSTSFPPSPTSLPKGSPMTPMRPAVPVGNWHISSLLGLLFLPLDFLLFLLVWLWWVLLSIVLLAVRVCFKGLCLRPQVHFHCFYFPCSCRVSFSLLPEIHQCLGHIFRMLSLFLLTFSQIIWLLVFFHIKPFFPTILRVLPLTPQGNP